MVARDLARDGQICKLKTVLFCAAAVVDQMSCGKKADTATKLSESFSQFFKQFGWGSIPGISPDEYRNQKTKTIKTEVELVLQLTNNKSFKEKKRISFPGYKSVSGLITNFMTIIKRKLESIADSLTSSRFEGLLIPAAHACVEAMKEIRDDLPFGPDAPFEVVQQFYASFDYNQRQLLQLFFCEGMEDVPDHLRQISHRLLLGMERWRTSIFYRSPKDDLSIVCQDDADKIAEALKDEEKAPFLRQIMTPFTSKRTWYLRKKYFKSQPV